MEKEIISIRNEKINYFNSTSVAERTKDVKSENEPLCLTIRRLLGNSERGTSELGDKRLLGIWSEIVVRKPSAWVQPTYSRSLARREQRTFPLEAIGRAGWKADGKDPTERERGWKCQGKRRTEHLIEHHSERGNGDQYYLLGPGMS